MYLHKLFFVVSICFLTNLNANALTLEDCQQRALNAYDNAAAVGGTDADKRKLGSYAANECFKEIEAQRGGSTSSSSGSDSSSSSSGSDSFGGAIIFLAAAVLLGYKMFWPHKISEREAYSAFRKVDAAYADNDADHPAIKQFKEEAREGQKEGFDFMLKGIRSGDYPLTQYDLKEMTHGTLADLSKAEQQVRETGKIKIEIARKFCRSCHTINDRSANICSSCGEALRSEEEIIASIERAEASKRLEKPLLDEQKAAMAKGLNQFAALIEQRARSAGSSHLFGVAQAYCKGEISRFRLASFGSVSVEMDAIYVHPPESSVEPGKFPVSIDRALDLGIECLEKQIGNKNKRKMTKGKLNSDREKIQSVARLFVGDNAEELYEENVKSSPFYTHVLKKSPELFKEIQRILLQCEVQDHARYFAKNKKPYFSLEGSISSLIPHPELLSKNQVEAADIEAIALIEEIIEKSAQKKKIVS